MWMCGVGWVQVREIMSEKIYEVLEFVWIYCKLCVVGVFVDVYFDYVCDLVCSGVLCEVGVIGGDWMVGNGLQFEVDISFGIVMDVFQLSMLVGSEGVL